MSRIPFGIIVSAILIGISYFSAKIYSSGLRLSHFWMLLIFFGFLLFSLLFILTIVLARSGTGSFGSVLYTFVQVAAGVGFYLFIGSVVLGVSLLIGRVAGFAVSTTYAWIILSLMLVLSIVGLLQARYIHTVTYTITLADAPAAWKDKTAALVADTHFGLINQERFAEKVTEKIATLHPDFVLHAGDFYDGPAINTVPVTAPWKALAQTTPIFFAPGNHEGYGDYRAFIDSLKQAGVTVLEDQATVYDGVSIVGLRYREKGAHAATANALATISLDQSKPAILINHPPTFQPEVAASGVDLMVSGHTHRGQFWPLNFLVRGIYGKYIYGMHTDGSLTSITTSGVGTFGPPFRLFNTPEVVLIRFK